MIKQKQRRKLLFPFGLISLAILPLLCLNYFYRLYINIKPEYAFELTFPNPADTLRSKNPLKRVNEKFTKITLNGKVEDKIKLDYAHVAIKELLHQRDTTLGLEFTFTNTAKYSSLVALLNYCEIEEACCYILYQDKFWVFNVRPKLDSTIVRNSYY